MDPHKTFHDNPLLARDIQIVCEPGYACHVRDDIGDGLHGLPIHTLSLRP